MFTTVLFACASLFVAHDSPKVVPAPPEFKSWKVVYLSSKDIWTCNGDGSGKRLVIKKGDTPCWSPDKKLIVFSRGNELWQANADGSGQRRLCTIRGRGDFEIGWITWSPHDLAERFYPEEVLRNRKPPGPAVVLSIYGNGRIAQSDIDGAGLFQYSFAHPAAGATALNWLEGGTGYSFSHYEFPEMSRKGDRLGMIVNGDIWIALGLPPHNANDTGWDITRLYAVAEYDAPTYRASRENHPANVLSWSPKADFLAYGVIRKGGSGTSDIAIIDLTHWNFDQTDPKKTIRLVTVTGYSPCFSPNGKWILHEHLSWQDGYSGLAAISADGKQIVHLNVDGEFPRW